MTLLPPRLPQLNETSSVQIIGLWLLMLVTPARLGSASMVPFTYDFPGSPGSGVASAQTNPTQLPGATFGDFTVTGAIRANGDNVFAADHWSTAALADPTIFASFDITAAAGYVLNLSQITFDSFRENGGPHMLDAALFINGSATPYATQTFAITTSLTNFQFNFTPLTDSDNVTSATGSLLRLPG